MKRFKASFAITVRILSALLAMHGHAAAASEPPVTLLYYTARDFSAPSRPEAPLLPLRELTVWTEKFIAKDLKRDLSAFLVSREWEALRESSLRAWRQLDQVPREAFVADIAASTYELKSRCIDSAKVGREATALVSLPTFEARGTPLCFDAKRIAKNSLDGGVGMVRAKLFGLAVHEHLHHFGFWDSDNRILNQFAERAQFWMKHRLPEPLRIEVSPRFQSLRERFRSGRPPQLSEARLRLRCSQENHSVDPIPPQSQERASLYLEWWKELEFARSLLDEKRIQVASSTTGSVPFTAHEVNLGEEGAWLVQGLQTDGFATFEQERSDAPRIAALLRKSEDGVFIAEVLYRPQLFPKDLQSTVVEGWSVVAYLECSAIP